MLRYPLSTVEKDEKNSTFYAFAFRYDRFSNLQFQQKLRSLFRSKKDILATIGSRVIPAGTINAGYV